jgi:hypothetical protein
VTPPPDLRLAELFVRYWDDALTPAEAEELEKRLAADPAARGWFQTLALQAVASADMRAAQPEPARTETGRSAEPAPVFQPPIEPSIAALAPEPGTPAPAVSGHGRRWSRRRALGLLGGGLAASISAVALGRWLWPESPPPLVALDRNARLGSVWGDVTVRAADGTVLPTDGPVPPGSTIAAGRGASAVLFYPNGTNVALTEDSAVTLDRTGEGDRLRLDRGVVAADVRAPLVGGAPLTLTTSETVLTGDGMIVTLYQAARATEVGVQRGSVNVSAPTGRPLGEVRDGELLTVQADGNLERQKVRETPDGYELDLKRTLPQGWAVGHRGAADKRPVLVPEFWFDPYHQRKMYQIRSDKQWHRGFFRLRPESVVRVRYRVERSGKGQVCFCVRTPDARSPDTGMLEWNGTYLAGAGADEWQTIEVAAGAMQNNRHAPKFCHPWVGFLFIFNTYETDLGLQVAEFGVSPGPTGPNPG